MSDERRFFEDIEVGESRELGTCEITAPEIVEFAERYDPQPFHVDEETAVESMYGGLIASGWQTAALAQREFATGFLNHTASLGARGVDDLRWRRPLYPDQEMTVRMEVVDTSVDPDASYGVVDIEVTMANPDGDTVLTMVLKMMIARREN